MSIASGLTTAMKITIALGTMVYLAPSVTALPLTTIPVNGGGVLTMSQTSATKRCEGDLVSYAVFTNFSYSLDTVINPSQQARYDQNASCVFPETITLKLQGGCTIVFNPAVMFNAGADPQLKCAGVPGYVGPKYIVVGVTYVPPGPSSFVQYSTSSFFGTTTSLSNSLSAGVSFSTSVTGGGSILKVLSGTITQTVSGSAMQTSTDSSSITVSIQNLFTTRLGGTPSAFSPVNHDYDIIWLWLNPAMLFTVYPSLPGFPSVVTWNGYGLDASDQPAMDIWPIEVGYLNGHFGSLPFEDASVLSRSWAVNQLFPAGQGPGLTSLDFENILRVDPFADSNYQVVLSSTAMPTTTVDGRFTISGATNGSAQSFIYRQPAPGSSPLTQTMTNTYTNTSTLGTTSSFQTQVGFGVEASLSGEFFAKLSRSLKLSFTLTQTHQSGRSVTATTTQIDTLSITGPPCGSNTPPCAPVYTGPPQFNVYQDNIFGTFMFNPVN